LLYFLHLILHLQFEFFILVSHYVYILPDRFLRVPHHLSISFLVTFFDLFVLLIDLSLRLLELLFLKPLVNLDLLLKYTCVVVPLVDFILSVCVFKLEFRGDLIFKQLQPTFMVLLEIIQP
jgi:hypothetical protein